MTDYIVTLKLPNNPNHDPKNKIEGFCPIDNESYCTDTTGGHHSLLFKNAPGAKSVQKYYESMGFHVTRIEAVNY